MLDAEEDANTVVQVYAQQVLAEPATNLLIFVYQTKSAERLAAMIGKETGCSALACHAQMSSSARQEAQAAFRGGGCRCLITTTALSLGVNLPATHVLIRDNTFPGVGRLSAGDLLQMMGRAGRGDTPGVATVLVRPTDQWRVEELTNVLQEERVADLTSALATLSSKRRHTDENPTDIEIVANRVAAHLARQPEQGVTQEVIRTFFLRSLGGAHVAAQIPGALQWLTDPMRVLAYQDEQERYHLTVLGRKAARTILPLPMVAGIAQLVRDLLTIDPTDALLTQWQPLDTLFLLNLLHERTPTLRPYSAALVEQIDSWMERSPAHHSLLYREWLRGAPAHSRAEEVLGSLGVTAPERTKSKETWAHRVSYGALLNSIILYERGQGVSQEELTRQWRLNNLAGVEERWRDDCLWLLSGLTQILDLRAFFYHLKESCQADTERIRQIKRLLRRMVRQCYQLQTELRYCSPLGAFLYSIRHAMTQQEKAVIGIQSIRRLEEAGITSPQALAQLTVEDLVGIGLRQAFARQIHTYLRRRLL